MVFALLRCLLQIESEYYERQQQRCHTEKLSKQRMWAYGRREEVRADAVAVVVREF
jgi:hypothetical protein